MSKISANSFLGNWHLTRFLQLGLGLGLVGSHFFYHPDNFTLAFGAILLVQAFLNVGCPLGACATPAGRRDFKPGADIAEQEVEYEEVYKEVR